MSPCKTCVRVVDPGMCEDKNCQQWRQWFMEVWDATRQRFALEEPLDPDPCVACLCPRELCAVPCHKKQAWEERP